MSKKRAVISKVADLGLGCFDESSVRMAKGTTFPVFLLGESLVVKLFDDDRAWQSEQDGLRQCGANAATADLVPRLLASGNFSRKRWKFVVVSMLKGRCVRVVKTLPGRSAIEMAATLGCALRAIHGSGHSSEEDRFGEWCRLMNERRARVSSQPWLRKRIKKESALLQLEPDSSFWPTNWTSLFRWGDRPCFLHGDLNNENVLYDKTSGKFGLLDFGDSFFGHRLYDFVAVHLSVFACEKALLSICLHNYGVDMLPDSPKTFAYACMVYTLLSDSPAFKTASFCRPKIKQCETLEEMAEILFAL